MIRPTISIVTPSLNQGRFIRTAISSVLDQEYPGLEYLVMDGGSKDESCQVASQFVPKLSLVSEKDGGQSDAINKGFARVSGEIIGWLNADDYYAPGALKKVAAAFAANPDITLVYGNAAYVGESGQPLGCASHTEAFNLDRLLGVGNFIVQPAAFFRRRSFHDAGGLREELNWSMDYDLWCRLGRSGKVLHIPDTLAFVRCYAGTKTAAGGRRRLAEVEKMLAEHGGRGLPAYFRLEAAAMDLHDALSFARQLEIRKALGSAGSALGRVALSPATIATLASPQTWRVMRTARERNARMATFN